MTGAPRQTPRRDSLVLTGADVNAVFAAFELAAEHKRHLAGTCAGCGDQSCSVCQVRLGDAEAFDRLADRLLRRRLAARPADSPGQAGSGGKETG